MDELQEIQEWFRRHCDGEWEHSYGIRIETCDNPGWCVRVNLEGTPLADKAFAAVSEGVSEDKMETAEEWLYCEVKDRVFSAAGDPSKLAPILRTFLEWAKRADVDAYGLELAEVAGRLGCGEVAVSVRGDGAARFVFASLGRRDVKISRSGEGWWVEFWDDEAVAADRTFPSQAEAIRTASAWVAPDRGSE